jgi:hypothetical protein
MTYVQLNELVFTVDYCPKFNGHRIWTAGKNNQIFFLVSRATIFKHFIL